MTQVGGQKHTVLARSHVPSTPPTFSLARACHIEPHERDTGLPGGGWARFWGSCGDYFHGAASCWAGKGGVGGHWAVAAVL